MSDPADTSQDSTGRRGIRAMTGRDPHEAGRTATPLELLYDLVFVVAFGVAGLQLAHSLAAGHPLEGLVAFALCMFAVIWAWINFAWFASAFDIDDWVYRLLTLVQMGGVMLLALGIPAVFASIEEGDHLNLTVLLIGYVVMRTGLVLQYARAYRDAPQHRPTIRAYIYALTLAQVGWVGLLIADPSLPVAFGIAAVLLVVELSGTYLAEHQGALPWHAHHIAERYGLLASIRGVAAG